MPYDSVPPQKDIYRTTPEFLVTQRHWGQRLKKWPAQGWGAMLHLDTQKGNEAMKASNFQYVSGGTTACMKILYIATKGCGQLTSNNNYFGDSWFSSVEDTEEMLDAGVNYCGPVKTSHNVFV